MTDTTTRAAPSGVAHRPGFLRQRTGLILPALLLIVGGVLAWGTFTMEVPSTATAPGPQIFPIIVSIGCIVLSVVLAIDVLRRPEPEMAVAPSGIAPAEAPTTTAVHLPGDALEQDDVRVRSNRRALLGAVATTAIFTAVIVPLGWLLSAALLFWGMARSLGSRRPVFDLFLALALSAAVQLAFSAGLGLALPPGILAGVL